MSTILGLRSFNRSQKFALGDKSLTVGKTALINVENKRVQRDVARHSALGSFIQVLAPFFQNDDGIVEQAGRVTTRATGLVLDVSAVNYTRASGVAGSGVAGTATVTAADVTNPRVDTVVVDTTAGTYSVIVGVATAGANDFNLLGKAVVPANRIVLAYAVVPSGAVNLAQTAVLDARP